MDKIYDLPKYLSMQTPLRRRDTVVKVSTKWHHPTLQVRVKYWCISVIV